MTMLHSVCISKPLLTVRLVNAKSALAVAVADAV